MKPLFSNKGLNSNKLMLLAKSKLVFEEPELAKVIKNTLLISLKTIKL